MKNKLPTPEEIFASPSASFWLKAALKDALGRDCVDAAYDAELLTRILMARMRAILDAK